MGINIVDENMTELFKSFAEYDPRKIAKQMEMEAVSDEEMNE